MNEENFGNILLLNEFKFYADRFNNTFQKIVNEEKNNRNLTGLEKSFLNELLIFYSSTNTFIETQKQELEEKNINFFSHPDSIMIIYPVLRRLLEVCINYAYIFDETGDISNRYSKYKEFVDSEYFNTYEILSSEKLEKIKKPKATVHKTKWPDIDKLPSPISCTKSWKENKFFDHFALINNNKYSNTDDSYCYKYEQLYDCYKILCFFTHGNVNIDLFIDIYSSNNFCKLSVIRLLNSLSEIYLNIIRNNFNSLYNKIKEFI